MRLPGRAHQPHNPWCLPALSGLTATERGGLYPDPSLRLGTSTKILAAVRSSKNPVCSVPQPKTMLLCATTENLAV